jgi:hypothetical protein
VHVRLFLKSPRFAVPDPVKFEEALAECCLQELSTAADIRRVAGAGGAASDAAEAAAGSALLLSAAAFALLRGHGLLCDHLAQLGYTSRLLGCLAHRAPSAAVATTPGIQKQLQAPAVAPGELGGSSLRLLHQLASSAGPSEALSTATAALCVPKRMAVMVWGPARASLHCRR